MNTTSRHLRSGRLGPVSWRWALRGLAWVIASLLAALVGPFTTYVSFGFWDRLLYWGGLIWAAMIVAFTLRRLLVTLLRRPADSLAVDIVVGVAHALVLGPMIWLFNYKVLEFQIGSLIRVFEHIGVVLVVCSGIVAVRMYMRRSVEEGLAPEAAQPEPDAAFLRRLEANLGQDLMRVSADDHYLLVVTKAGETRVLMRFRDALEELSGMPGYRIHRSHWVSRDAVVRVRPDGRRHVAELQCGSELPVSSAYLNPLREDGLLASRGIGTGNGALP